MRKYKSKKILFIFGTRPEAIKMAPLIKDIQSSGDKFSVEVCITGQHKQLLEQVTNFFGISADYDLRLMKPNQTLFDITADAIRALEKVINKCRPELIFVQGDTSTAFVGALAGYYKKIKISHLEAGLRSSKKYSPFPEEINRRLVSHIADYHFAPTEIAVENLRAEGITRNVWNVGNTVVDALLLTSRIVEEGSEEGFYEFFKFLDLSKRIILITGHRRESFGKPLQNMCCAFREISKRYRNVELVYPVHLNPNVRLPVTEALKGIDNIHLIEPLEYPYFIWLMNKCYFVLTDSGGVQEEAPSLGKPVLVMRDVTERVEGIKAGTAKLVGTYSERIIKEVDELMTSNDGYKKMANAVNPYGDGRSSQKIIEILRELYKET